MPITRTSTPPTTPPVIAPILLEVFGNEETWKSPGSNDIHEKEELYIFKP